MSGVCANIVSNDEWSYEMSRTHDAGADGLAELEAEAADYHGECWGMGHCDCPECRLEEAREKVSGEGPDSTCRTCDGAGWLQNRKGERVTCQACGGKGDPDDDDPQCVCGVYRSEHAMLAYGCSGFTTKGQWESEKSWIQSMDEDTYERVSEMMGW